MTGLGPIHMVAEQQRIEFGAASALIPLSALALFSLGSYLFWKRSSLGGLIWRSPQRQLAAAMACAL